MEEKETKTKTETETKCKNEKCFCTGECKNKSTGDVSNMVTVENAPHWVLGVEYKNGN